MKKRRVLVLAADRSGADERGAHIMAEQLVKMQLGPDAVLLHDGSGAPYTEGGRKCFVSVSHSSGLVVCAFADFPIGVDTEPSARRVPEKIAERFTRGVSRDPVRGWTEIEASLKLFGHGLEKIRECETFLELSERVVKKIDGNVVTVAAKRSDSPFSVRIIKASCEEQETVI